MARAGAGSAQPNAKGSENGGGHAHFDDVQNDAGFLLAISTARFVVAVVGEKPEDEDQRTSFSAAAGAHENILCKVVEKEGKMFCICV